MREQGTQLAETRSIFLEQAWDFILAATDNIEHIGPMQEMIGISAQNMLGRLSSIEEQKAFMWYVSGVTDIGTLLVKTLVQARQNSQ